METGYIYGVRCVCHPKEGVRYVGQTSKGVEVRRAVHLWNARTKESKTYNSYFSNWIRKHGEENVEFFTLEKPPVKELDNRERHWISTLREKYKLTNLLEGGVQARGHKRPDHSEKMKGRGNPMFGKDRREIMAYARSFQGPPSDETKQLWSKQRTGEGNSRAVLTEEDVRELRKEEKRYGLFSEWARRFGVTPQTIRSAYLRETWKHVE